MSTSRTFLLYLCSIIVLVLATSTIAFDARAEKAELRDPVTDFRMQLDVTDGTLCPLLPKSAQLPEECSLVAET